METISFQEAYWRVLRDALGSPIKERNKRTGHEVKVIDGGFAFALDLTRGRLPLACLRKTYPKSAAAEVAWFASGSDSVKFMKKYAPCWDKFVESDGDTIAAAYGHRWRRHFGRDQLGLAVKAMIKDPSDRQAIVMAWDPATDALGAEAKKNVPCPLAFHLWSRPALTPRGDGLIERALCMSVYMRSSDVFVGLPYDVMGHAMLLNAIRWELVERDSGLRDLWRLGTLQFCLSHAHLYDSHYGYARQCIAGGEQHGVIEPRMLNWSLSEIEKLPDTFVEEMTTLQHLMWQPGFHCRPEVIE